MCVFEGEGRGSIVDTSGECVLTEVVVNTSGECVDWGAS